MTWASLILLSELGEKHLNNENNHNRQAVASAKSYRSLDELVDDFISTRKRLLELLNEKYDDSTSFTIDDQKHSFNSFIDIFIHHDEHHKQQIEAFWERGR